MSTLKSVVDRYPSELSVWNDLGVKCLLAGQQEEARKAFTEVRIHSLTFLDQELISHCYSFVLVVVLLVLLGQPL